MLRLQNLVSLILVAMSTVDANSLIHREGGEGTLRFTKKLHPDIAGGRSLAVIDRAHARAMIRMNDPDQCGSTITVANAAIVYTTEVGIGEPQHSYTLLIDTGSSNTWVGGNSTRPYIRTKTSIDTGNSFSVSYGSGSVNGEEFLDTLTLSSTMVVRNQSIGATNASTTGFNGADGILGLGSADLTVDTVKNTGEVPTVVDNLYSQGAIQERVFGVYFAPFSEHDNTGELKLGGYDPTVAASPIDYVPLTKTSKYWAVNQSISYGESAIMENTIGVADTGTTLILLETNAFQRYQNATGAVLDPASGMLKINSAQYANLKPLSFRFGDASFDLSPNAQIWPRSINNVTGGDENGIYLVVNDLGSVSSFGMQALIGYCFLERFYIVFDATNKRLGFARTAYTDAVIN